MRKRRVRPKVRQTVSNPVNLQEFLHEVNELIETQDDAATIESDDLLQCECAYGGLIDAGSIAS